MKDTKNERERGTSEKRKYRKKSRIIQENSKFPKRNRMRRRPGVLLQHRLLLTAVHLAATLKMEKQASPPCDARSR